MGSRHMHCFHGNIFLGLSSVNVIITHNAVAIVWAWHTVYTYMLIHLYMYGLPVPGFITAISQGPAASPAKKSLDIQTRPALATRFLQITRLGK
jgi:hypothetical protein